MVQPSRHQWHRGDANFPRAALNHPNVYAPINWPLGAGGGGGGAAFHYGAKTALKKKK